VEWRHKTRQIKAAAAKIKVEKLTKEAGAAADEKKLEAYSSGLKMLADRTGMTEVDVVVEAVRFARDKQNEFHEFVHGRPPPARGLQLPGDPWIWQTVLVLYLFAVLLAFMLGMLYSPAITVIVSVATLLVMFLWPGWGVILSIAVIVVALVSVL
jgi:hypothetical protein